ncbi:MAG: TIGR01777 family oxidoreductase [Flavobacteriaceae bacterium]|nr:TIGR01777 family oxidoreductase [Flavobacteriaceae bacterium]
MENKIVLITGGTGLIGSQLSKLLFDKGYQVRILSRAKNSVQKKAYHYYHWNIETKEIDIAALKSVHYIIHLAGAGIADKRWTAARKKHILDSRVNGATLLLETLKQLNHRPLKFIAASGIGFYGAINSPTIFTEKAPPQNDFLGNVCKTWEQSSLKFEKRGIPTSILRTGIVLSKNGGALKKLSQTFLFNFGTALGDGRQYMPWIHIDDLCQLYLLAIEAPEFIGIYNAVSPEHTTNSEFTKAITKRYKRSFLLPNTPSLVLKIVLGTMSEMVLNGARVSPEKLIQFGFKFQYSTLKKALEDLIK